jgi:small subunit ribosomal protein S2
MTDLKEQDCLAAGVHIGHLTKRWNPHMANYIFMESHGRHIIDVKKTIAKTKEAAEALHKIVAAGEKVLFVSTKKQVKDYIDDMAKSLNMPFMTEKWFGGTLTNFITVRKLIKKINAKDKMISSPIFKFLAKKEQLVMIRKNEKLKKNLAGILEMMRLPGAVVVVDMNKDFTAVREAKKLAIPVFSLVDSNSNPTFIDYPIPANDDLISSVKLIFDVLKEAIEKGISDFENNVVAIKDEENKTERRVKKVEKTPRINAEAPKNEVSEKVTPKKVEKTVAKKPVVNDINLNDKSKLKNVLSGNKAK